VTIIKAREEFSLPQKLDLKPKQNQIKARLPSPAESRHGSAVIKIDSEAINSLSSSSLGLKQLENQQQTRRVYKRGFTTMKNN